MGTIINLLIYFDSTEGNVFTVDNESPYYFDANGELQKKSDISNFTVNDLYLPSDDSEPMQPPIFDFYPTKNHSLIEIN